MERVLTSSHDELVVEGELVEVEDCELVVG
jgi:hypothetical protein